MSPLRIYVINLAASVERRALIEGQLERLALPYRLWSAIDGRALSAEDVARVYSEAAAHATVGRPLGASEIGCYLSHVAALEDLLASGADRALILEDDALLSDDVALLLDHLERLPAGWDVFLLGPLNLRRARSHLPGRRVVAGYRACDVFQAVYGAGAYVITRRAAAELVAAALPARRPFDLFWDPEADPRLRVLVCSPAAVTFPPQTTAQSLLEAERLALEPWRTSPDTLPGGDLVRRLLGDAAHDLALSRWVDLKNLAKEARYHLRRLRAAAQRRHRTSHPPDPSA